MKYADIKSRVESLRRELAEIAEHNRRYFSRKNHSAEERAQHRQLQDRVRQIRGELYFFLEQAKAA
jgi:hypothetical protein